MRDHTSVIVGAVVTEKSERLKSGQNKYTFRVASAANKIDVRHAIERLFKVHVTDVRMMNYLGQRRRMGVYVGRRPSWKKAIVRIKPGETIEVLER